MDPATAEFYARNAKDLAARYEASPGSVATYFGMAFPAGCRVLDVGAGSGRDLAALLAHGFDAYGVEPSEAMRAEALEHHPALAGRLESGALPPIGLPFGGGFDGVLCSAVLMHLAEAELFDAAFALRDLLRPHGRLLVSLPLARTDVGSDNRDVAGRLFTPCAPGRIQLLFERLGFIQIGRWDDDDALGRSGTRWYTLLLELRAGGPLRAIDQIEGILNRDRKVATYKLALFCALAELATQEPWDASWRADGAVGVPIRRIAEKWLLYFWPLFASATFVPQSQSEGAGGKHLKFRQPMSELMAPYSGAGAHGGLATWHLDVQGGRLSPERKVMLARALRAIASAIRDGPVDYAGGSLQTGTVFTYDRGTADVVMASDLWLELSLLGHWIHDAVVLRWATLTERFGHRQGIRSSDVLPLLLARPEPERATLVARQIFGREGGGPCTWTGRPLGAAFAVDHVIPFALWASNDLWNLMPVEPAVNNQKSDKLPAAALLRARQHVIVDYWKLLRDCVPAAFDHEAAHLLGHRLVGPQAWEAPLFSRLREAVEITALQRGIERWSPTTRSSGLGA